jgi:hypothetical protein
LPADFARASLNRVTAALDKTAKKFKKARRQYKAPIAKITNKPF